QSATSMLPQMVLSGVLLLIACLTVLADRPRHGEWLCVFAFALLAMLWATSTPSARAQTVSTFALLAGGGAAWVIGLHLGPTARRRSLGDRVSLTAGLAGMIWLFAWMLASGGGSVFRDALGSGHDSGALYVSLLVLATSRLLTVPPRRGSRNMSLTQRWSETASRRPATVALAVLSGAAIAQTGSGPILAISVLAISGVFALQVEARKDEDSFPFGTPAFPALLVFNALAGLVVTISMMLALAGITDTRAEVAIYRDTIVEAVRAAPLLGHGLGSHAEIIAAASTPDAVGPLTRVKAAGLWPTAWLLEIGLLGVAAITLGLLHVVRVLWGGIRASKVSAAHGLILCWIALACAVTGIGLAEPVFLWLLMFLIAESYAACTAPAREN
ncbi:MAG: hypothetical protein AAFW65_08805, partial [Pseudomonadota bacterium]